MKIHYGILSQGQGHLVRSAEMIRTLRARGHTVDVLVAGDPPPVYARTTLGEFAYERLPNLVLRDGKLDKWGTFSSFTASVPRRLSVINQLRKNLSRKRVDLVFTDFEPLTALAARLAGVPCVGLSGQYRITRTDSPFPKAPFDRAVALAIMRTWTPGLHHYFAVSFSPAHPARPRTDVVAPIIDVRVREQAPRHGGFFLAYLYSYPKERVLEALRGHGPFRVYGFDVDERVGEVEFRRTDRASFVQDLASCEGVVLNGSFQAVCEAVVLGKPVLSIPFGGQYEERFNANLVEICGLGIAANELSREAIGRFVTWQPTHRPADPGDGAAQVIQTLGL